MSHNFEYIVKYSKLIDIMFDFDVTQHTELFQ